MASIVHASRLGILVRQRDHFLCEIYSERLSGDCFRKRDAVMTGSTADIEHPLPLNRRTTCNRHLVPQPHACSEIPVDPPIYKSVAVSIYGIEVIRIRIKKLSRTIGRHGHDASDTDLPVDTGFGLRLDIPPSIK